VLTEKYKYF